MSKSLETLQEIKSKPFSWEKLKDSLDTIEKELKALEIIKKIVKIIDYSDYTIADGNLMILQGGEIKNKDEYELLKEILK